MFICCLNTKMKIDFTKYINLSQLSHDQQQLFVGAMTDLILARMADMVGDHLTDEEISQLEKLSAEADSNQIITWLNQHIPNFASGIDEILAEESQIIASQVTALNNLALQEA